MGEGGGGEALSLFRFHLSPFPPETPDTQASATPSLLACVLLCRGPPPTSHEPVTQATSTVNYSALLSQFQKSEVCQ